MAPMAPALFSVSSNIKTMFWPLEFALPGHDPVVPTGPDSMPDIRVVTVPSRVVATARFSDAIVEPVVRRVNQELRNDLKRDGLACDTDEDLKFAQYDAIFSMGKRRSEVQVILADGGHPF